METRVGHVLNVMVYFRCLFIPDVCFGALLFSISGTFWGEYIWKEFRGALSAILPDCRSFVFSL